MLYHRGPIRKCRGIEVDPLANVVLRTVRVPVIHQEIPVHVVLVVRDGQVKWSDSVGHV